MNRAERRRLKRQEENMRAEQIVNKAIGNLLNKYLLLKNYYLLLFSFSLLLYSQYIQTAYLFFK